MNLLINKLIAAYPQILISPELLSIESIEINTKLVGSNFSLRSSLLY